MTNRERRRSGRILAHLTASAVSAGSAIVINLLTESVSWLWVTLVGVFVLLNALVALFFERGGRADEPAEPTMSNVVLGHVGGINIQGSTVRGSIRQRSPADAPGTTGESGSS